VTLEDRVRELADEVPPPGRDRRARGTIAALGAGEAAIAWEGSKGLGARLAGMAGECPPAVPEVLPSVICAGDHGVLDRGVSPWPQAVTAAMVRNICEGGAAANAIAKTVGARVSVLDVGSRRSWSGTRSCGRRRCGLGLTT
jgi:nicotinate-nucleotide--dimethylbenzimidazole phosphoribosyltransferase